MVAECYKFHARAQHNNETVGEYRGRVPKIAISKLLEDALRDRFVCGLKSTTIQKKLLNEADLSLQKAFAMAQSLEAVETQAFQLQQTPINRSPADGGGASTVSKVVKTTPKTSKDTPATANRKACYRRGRTNHTQDKCYFREKTCNNCNKKGHMAKVCKSPKKKAQAAMFVETDEEDDETFLHTIQSSQHKAIEVTLLINDTPVIMEVDTGAAVSIISEEAWKGNFPNATWEPSEVTLKTYSGEKLSVCGQAVVTVAYKDQTARLPVQIVKGAGPALLGRDWLFEINLDWKAIKQISVLTLEGLLAKYSELFQETLGSLKGYQAVLEIKEGAKPRFLRPRPVPYALREAIEQELDRLEAQGIIEKVSSSDWATPVVPIPKADGSIRLCGDFKVTVNPVLESDQHPLPRVEDLFATLAGGKLFTKLDLAQAYLQVPLDCQSRQYVTINTHKGLYRYTRLPFGLSSAPAVFQKTIEKILQGLPGIVAYLDDVLVTGKDERTHLENLERVLARLQEYGLNRKKAKCTFMAAQVEYLGYRVSGEGIHTSPGKTSDVSNAPRPNNVQELRSFLGLVNYYGKFVPNLASIAAPVLVHFDPTLPLRLSCDASSYGVGAVLAHIMTDGSERPVAYASRTLTPAEKNYAQVERESLALIFGVKRFHLYLYGRLFTLITDHKPLTTILGAKTGISGLAAARLQRWAVILSSYRYQLEFRKGSTHCNADALSRLPREAERVEADMSKKAAHLFNITQLESLPVNARQIARETAKDPVLSKVLQYTLSGWPKEVDDVILKPYFYRRTQLGIEEGCLMWGMRVIVPTSLRKRVLEELHNTHPGSENERSCSNSCMVGRNRC